MWARAEQNGAVCAPGGVRKDCLIVCVGPGAPRNDSMTATRLQGRHSDSRRPPRVRAQSPRPAPSGWWCPVRLQVPWRSPGPTEEGAGRLEAAEGAKVMVQLHSPDPAGHGDSTLS